MVSIKKKNQLPQERKCEFFCNCLTTEMDLPLVGGDAVTVVFVIVLIVCVPVCFQYHTDVVYYEAKSCKNVANYSSYSKCIRVFIQLGENIEHFDRSGNS